MVSILVELSYGDVSSSMFLDEDAIINRPSECMRSIIEEAKNLADGPAQVLYIVDGESQFLSSACLPQFYNVARENGPDNVVMMSVEVQPVDVVDLLTDEEVDCRSIDGQDKFEDAPSFHATSQNRDFSWLALNENEAMSECDKSNVMMSDCQSNLVVSDGQSNLVVSDCQSEESWECVCENDAEGSKIAENAQRAGNSEEPVHQSHSNMVSDSAHVEQVDCVQPEHAPEAERADCLQPEHTTEAEESTQVEQADCVETEPEEGELVVQADCMQPEDTTEAEESAQVEQADCVEPEHVTEPEEGERVEQADCMQPERTTEPEESTPIEDSARVEEVDSGRIPEELMREELPDVQEPEPTPHSHVEHIVEHIMAVITTQLCGADIRIVLPILAQKMLDFLASQGMDSAPDSLLKVRDGDVSDIKKCAFECVVFGASLTHAVRNELLMIIQSSFLEAVHQPPTVEVHANIICDGCDMDPIVGKRFRSLERPDYDLCEKCMEGHNPSYYQQMSVHANIICDGCNMHPIVGKRFRSLERPDYDLCEKCMEGHNPSYFQQMSGSQADDSFSHSNSFQAGDVHVSNSVHTVTNPFQAGDVHVSSSVHTVTNPFQAGDVHVSSSVHTVTNPFQADDVHVSGSVHTVTNPFQADDVHVSGSVHTVTNPQPMGSVSENSCHRMPEATPKDNILLSMATGIADIEPELIAPVFARETIKLADVFCVPHIIPESLVQVAQGHSDQIQQATSETTQAINELDACTRDSFLANLRAVLEESISQEMASMNSFHPTEQSATLPSPVVLTCDCVNSSMDPGDLDGEMASFAKDEFKLSGAFFVGQFNSRAAANITFMNPSGEPIENAALRLCYGGGMGFGGIELGTIAPHEVFEVLMDFNAEETPCKGMSCWALTANDTPVGSLLVADTT